MKTKIAVNGACGRMGKRIVQLACEDETLHVVAALDSSAHPEHARDIGERFVGQPGRRHARRDQDDRFHVFRVSPSLFRYLCDASPRGAARTARVMSPPIFGWERAYGFL